GVFAACGLARLPSFSLHGYTCTLYPSGPKLSLSPSCGDTIMSERKKKGVDVPAITEALAAPFGLDEVKFKPQVVKGNRALALAYIDARVIQDRLDEVLGVEGWQDRYRRLEDGTVICRLTLRIGEEWITKMDVGSPSEQPDGGDR